MPTMSTDSSAISTESTISSELQKHCAQFEIRDTRNIQSLVIALDSNAQHFARSPKARADVGSDPQLWTHFRQLWRNLSKTQLSNSFWRDGDISAEDLRSANQKQKQNKDEECIAANHRLLCIALSKFTRNLVAGVFENQLMAFEIEPDIRSLLHYYTSWSELEGSESVKAARALTQALSNIVTSNEALVDMVWNSYMNLPEDEVVLVRLIGSHDPQTLLTTLIFILNCTHKSTKRMQRMVESNVGVRICIGLLDKMVTLHEADEGSEGARAFDIGYMIVAGFIETGLIPELYRQFHMTNEIMTPHQTTLLKLLDSHLHTNQARASNMQISDIFRIHTSLSSFLARRFFSLSYYAQRAIHKSLGMTPFLSSRHKNEGASFHDSSVLVQSVSSSSSESESSPGLGPATKLQQINIMLPKVCEALVLVTQCIVTLCLEAEEQRARVENGSSTYTDFTNMKDYLNRKKYQENGMVESLIDLLCLLDVFLPRINFGKPVNREGTPADPQLTSGGDPARGFLYLKRDLVRLLGVLCHEAKVVQDRARRAGGLPVVMNMCVIDERNPYLREHAIFTLRNLLKDNPENQKFVDDVKPAKEWLADGTLKSRVKMSKVKQ